MKYFFLSYPKAGGANKPNDNNQIYDLLDTKTLEKIFNIVDLAGSERQSTSNSKGIRLREAGQINKSLLELTNVINALVKKQNYIPYRCCNLTRILKESLGGNSFTYLIECITSSSIHSSESLSTLKFANTSSVYGAIEIPDHLDQKYDLHRPININGKCYKLILCTSPQIFQSDKLILVMINGDIEIPFEYTKDNDDGIEVWLKKLQLTSREKYIND